MSKQWYVLHTYAGFEGRVKASLVVTHKQGLMVGARTFSGNPY